MPAHRRGRRGSLAALLLVASLLLPAARAAAADPLGVLPISTQHWVGDNALILQLFTPDGAPITDPALAVTVTPVAPDGTRGAAVPAGLGRWAVTGRDLWIARVPLTATGTWGVEVQADGPDGTRTGSSTIVVRPDVGTPALGSPAPATDTPTLADVLNLTDALSSDPDQVAAFYWKSVADLVRDGQPFVLVLDSYLFRPNEACGGALGIIHDIFIEYPGLSIVHAEPWLTRFATGMLTLEPPDGPAALAPWSVAWGLAEPPWVFVVDRTGIVRAKLTGIFGTDELRAAMAGVIDWHPLGAPTPSPRSVTG